MFPYEGSFRNGVHITIAEDREAWTDEYGEDIDPRAFAIIERPESMVIVSIDATKAGAVGSGLFASVMIKLYYC